MKAGGSRSLCLEKKKVRLVFAFPVSGPLLPTLSSRGSQPPALAELAPGPAAARAGLAPGYLANPTLTIQSPDLSLGLPKLALRLDSKFVFFAACHGLLKTINPARSPGARVSQFWGRGYVYKSCRDTAFSKIVRSWTRVSSLLPTRPSLTPRPASFTLPLPSVWSDPV